MIDVVVLIVYIVGIGICFGLWKSYTIREFSPNDWGAFEKLFGGLISFFWPILLVLTFPMVISSLLEFMAKLGKYTAKRKRQMRMGTWIRDFDSRLRVLEQSADDEITDSLRLELAQMSEEFGHLESGS